MGEDRTGHWEPGLALRTEATPGEGRVQGESERAKLAKPHQRPGRQELAQVPEAGGLLLRPRY